MKIFFAVVFSLVGLVVVYVTVKVVRMRRRRKSYEEPEVAGSGRDGKFSFRKVDRLSQIPLDNIYHPISTPISTSRTSLVGSAD